MRKKRSDWVVCEIHPRCIVRFRTTRRFPDGTVRSARSYGYVAWPIHERNTLGGAAGVRLGVA